MANDRFNSPWGEKTKDDVPEFLRRPADYEDPKKETKRDREKEKAERDRTPEFLRKREEIGFESFGLRDAVDKNARLMSDEDIAAERAEEREKRAEKISPKRAKEEPAQEPAKEPEEKKSGGLYAELLGQRTEEPSQSESMEVEQRASFEVVHGVDVLPHMREVLASDGSIDAAARAQMEQRLNAPETAMGVSNNVYLVGEVDGQKIIHQLTEDEHARLTVYSGAHKEMYANELLQLEKAEQEQQAAADRRKKESEGLSPESPMMQLNKTLRILLTLLGVDTSMLMPQAESQQQQAQQVVRQPVDYGVTPGETIVFRSSDGDKEAAAVMRNINEKLNAAQRQLAVGGENPSPRPAVPSETVSEESVPVAETFSNNYFTQMMSERQQEQRSAGLRI